MQDFERNEVMGKAKEKKGLYIAAAVAAATVAVIVLAVILVLGGREETYRSIRIVELEGSVTIDRESVGSLKASANMNLFSGDYVSTSAGAYVVLRLDEDKYVMLGEQGAMKVEADGDASKGRTAIHLEAGSILSEIQNPLGQNSTYEIVTPSATMSVRGTVFETRRNGTDNDGNIEVLVYEGQVAVSFEGQESILYSGGEYTQFTAGDTPRFLVERSAITEEQMNSQMLQRLQQIEENGRSLDFGRTNLEDLIGQKDSDSETLVADNSQVQESEGNDNLSDPEAQNPETPSPSPDVTASDPPASTARPRSSSTPAPIVTPAPTAEPEPAATPAPAEAPAPAATPAPTEAPASAATPAPTETPAPAATPAPTETPAPAATPTPSATQTPAATSTPSADPTPTVTPEQPEEPTPSDDPWTDDSTAVDAWKNALDNANEPTETEDGDKWKVIFYMPGITQLKPDVNDPIASLGNTPPEVYGNKVQLLTNGSRITEKPVTPTFNNLPGAGDQFKFEGWYTEQGQKWDFENDTVTSNIYLFPVWENSEEKCYYYPVILRDPDEGNYYCFSVKAGSYLLLGPETGTDDQGYDSSVYPSGKYGYKLAWTITNSASENNNERWDRSNTVQGVTSLMAVWEKEDTAP